MKEGDRYDLSNDTKEGNEDDASGKTVDEATDFTGNGGATGELCIMCNIGEVKYIVATVATLANFVDTICSVFDDEEDVDVIIDLRCTEDDSDNVDDCTEDDSPLHNTDDGALSRLTFNLRFSFTGDDS